MYQLICMSFDGDYQREKREFKNIDDAWNYSNDLGSKWFFYPFHFIVKNKTIKDSPDQLLEWTKNKRIKTVQEVFKKHSEKPETQGLDCFDFILSL